MYLESDIRRWSEAAVAALVARLLLARPMLYPEAAYQNAAQCARMRGSLLERASDFVVRVECVPPGESGGADLFYADDAGGGWVVNTAALALALEALAAQALEERSAASLLDTATLAKLRAAHARVLARVG